MKLLQRIRRIKQLKRFYQKGNTITIVSLTGDIKTNPLVIQNLDIVATGSGNRVILHTPYTAKMKIRLTSNTEIVIESGCEISGTFCIIKTRGEQHNFVHIGKNFGCGSNATIDITDHGNVIIGEDCKFSWNIYIKSDDTHPVFSVISNKAINESTQIVIGNHVWIGMNTTILKNSRIPSNCVIGACSVVAGKFDTENCALAGNPARIVKNDINWSHGSIADFIKTQS